MSSWGQGCLGCSPPDTLVRKGGSALSRSSGGKENSSVRPSEICFPSGTTPWPLFFCGFRCNAFRCDSWRIQLKPSQVNGTSRSRVGFEWLLQGCSSISLSFSCALPVLASSLGWYLHRLRAYHTKGRVLFIQWLKENIVLCLLNQGSFAAGLHWYSCSSC